MSLQKKKHKACVPLILYIETQRSLVNFLYLTIMFVANILQANGQDICDLVFVSDQLIFGYHMHFSSLTPLTLKSWPYEVPQKFLQTKNWKNVQNIVIFPIFSRCDDILSVSVILSLNQNNHSGTKNKKCKKLEVDKNIFNWLQVKENMLWYFLLTGSKQHNLWLLYQKYQINYCVNNKYPGSPLTSAFFSRLLQTRRSFKSYNGTFKIEMYF